MQPKLDEIRPKSEFKSRLKNSSLDAVSASAASTRSARRSLTTILAESQEESMAPSASTILVRTESSSSRSDEDSTASRSFLTACAISVSSRCWGGIQYFYAYNLKNLFPFHLVLIRHNICPIRRHFLKTNVFEISKAMR